MARLRPATTLVQELRQVVTMRPFLALGMLTELQTAITAEVAGAVRERGRQYRQKCERCRLGMAGAGRADMFVIVAKDGQDNPEGR